MIIEPGQDHELQSNFHPGDFCFQYRERDFNYIQPLWRKIMFPAARKGDPITHDMLVPSGVIGPPVTGPCPMGPVMIEGLPAAHVHLHRHLLRGYYRRHRPSATATSSSTDCQRVYDRVYSRDAGGSVGSQRRHGRLWSFSRGPEAGGHA